MHQHACSNIEEDGWLVGKFLLLDAQGSSVCLVVDVRKVTGGWALTYTTEFVIN